MQENFIIGFTLIHHAKLDFVHNDTILRIDVITFLSSLQKRMHCVINTFLRILIHSQARFDVHWLAYIFRVTLFISISVFVIKKQ